MKKLLLLVLFLLILPIVLADVEVTYNFYNNLGNPVNNVDVLSYSCNDSQCSSVNLFTRGNSNQFQPNNSFTIQYPTIPKTSYGYANYYYKEGYIPKEDAPIKASGTPSEIPNVDIYFNKGENCEATIENLYTLNSAEEYIPLIINVQANIGASVNSPFHNLNIPPLYKPQEYIDKGFYSAKTDVVLTIYDEDDRTVYQETKNISLFMDESKIIQFTWTPQEPGNYKIEVETLVIDNKCNQQTMQPDSASKLVYVLEEQPRNLCYTLLNNVTPSTQTLELGQSLTINFQKISNAADANTNLTPLPTLLQTDSISSNFPANSNYYDFQQYSVQYTPTQIGSQTITLVASALNCPYTTNLEDTAIISINITTPTQPQEEVCDGIDNDQDSLIDEDLVRQYGATDIGICEYGTETCINGIWVITKESIEPTEEVCDTLDNDCDSLTDEELTIYTGTDVGKCQQGITKCVNGNMVVTQQEITPTEEICDNLDNDCDSLIDESLTRSYGATDIGVCEYGIETCTAGIWVITTPSIEPITEVCDNLDNDCDSQTDEDLTIYSGTDVGECQQGITECINGNIITTQNEITPITEIFDGLDNDCDNLIDENFNPPILITPLPDQIMYENTILQNAFDLDNYFSDPDNDILNYTVTGSTHITVTINQNNEVTFIPNPNWYGIEPSITFTASDSYFSVQDTIQITVIPVNTLPIANAGPDQTILLHNPVMFDASASYDPDSDGFITEYHWNFGDGQTASGINPTHIYQYTGILPITYTTTLTVTDNEGGIATDITLITITADYNEAGINAKPILNLNALISEGNELHYVEGDLIKLDLKKLAWDINHDFIEYKISGVPKLTQVDNNIFTWQTKTNDAGTYIAKITATDGYSTVEETIKIVIYKHSPHKFSLNSIVIEPIISQNNQEIFVKIRNTDKYEDTNLRLSAQIPELNIYSTSKKFNLEPRETKWVNLRLDIPKNTPLGEYIVKITIEDNKASSSKYTTFVID